MQELNTHAQKVNAKLENLNSDDKSLAKPESEEKIEKAKVSLLARINLFEEVSNKILEIVEKGVIKIAGIISLIILIIQLIAGKC